MNGWTLSPDHLTAIHEATDSMVCWSEYHEVWYLTVSCRWPTAHKSLALAMASHARGHK